jgi:sulfur carrier protein ThiS
MSEKFVKVAKLGQEVKEFYFDNGATIASIFRAGGISSTGFAVRLNGRESNVDRIVSDGDIITLVPKIKGGSEYCFLLIQNK